MLLCGIAVKQLNWVSCPFLLWGCFACISFARLHKCIFLCSSVLKVHWQIFTVYIHQCIIIIIKRKSELKKPPPHAKRVTIELLGYYTCWPLGSLWGWSPFAVASHFCCNFNMLLYFLQIRKTVPMLVIRNQILQTNT